MHVSTESGERDELFVQLCVAALTFVHVQASQMQSSYTSLSQTSTGPRWSLQLARTTTRSHLRVTAMGMAPCPWPHRGGRSVGTVGVESPQSDIWKIKNKM